MRVPAARLLRPTAFAAALALASCGPMDDPGDDETPELTSADAMFEGAPDNESLPTEGKADAVYAKKFDLLRTQSPVRNQSGRGVCSVFAAAALMEHLYRKAGMTGVPDFSEQYLQWSVKNQAKRMADIEASTVAYNLEAIEKFGVVEESVWPYESSRWSTSNDPACTGGDKNLPTRCYTNGAPPEAAASAPLYKLPGARFLRADVNTFKAHMTGTSTGIALTVKFYYQAWNHGLSKLPVNREYSRNGWVLAPNSEDLKQEPAGHAVLLVGWDDDLQVQKRGADGAGLVDSAGKPVMEKGFFAFKNSWGAGSFGATHPYGPGYGWISYDYVKRFGVANVTNAPRSPWPAEVCGDKVDNDHDGNADCADTDCSPLPACRSAIITIERTPGKSIPDGSTTGLTDSASVTMTGTVKGVSVLVDIAHPKPSELVIVLQKGTKKATLFNRGTVSGPGLEELFETSAFDGLSVKGTWSLKVTDAVRGNVGTLRSWELEIKR